MKITKSKLKELIKEEIKDTPSAPATMASVQMLYNLIIDLKARIEKLEP